MDDLSSGYPHRAILGGNVGLFARVKPPILPGVQGEALISTLGTEVSVEGQDVRLRTVSLQLPLFAIFSLGPVEVHAGGYYDRNLARTLTGEAHVDIDGTTVSTNDLSDGGWGLLGGAGVHLGSFYAAARYNWGMAPIGNGPYLGDVKSRQIQLYLAWGFFH